jgi:putative membrane protein
MRTYLNAKKRMILRDELAVDRTALANERTYLAYIRTAVTLLAAGIGFVKLFEEPGFTWLGVFTITSSFCLLTYGVWRFIGVRRRLRTLDEAIARRELGDGDETA